MLALPDPAKPRFRLSLIATAILLAVVLVISLLAPRFDGLVLEELDGRAVYLRLHGERLSSLTWLWESRWRSALAKEGLEPDDEAEVKVTEDGKQAHLAVRPRPDFDAVTLPLPAPFLGRGPRRPLHGDEWLGLQGPSRGCAHFCAQNVPSGCVFLGLAGLRDFFGVQQIQRLVWS